MEAFDNRNLILKEYKVFCKIEGELEEAIMIVTVDGFLNITGGHHVKLEEIHFEYSFRIDNSLTITPDGDINLVIQARKKNLINLLNDSREDQLEIVFNNEDMRDEFCSFTEKITK